MAERKRIGVPISGLDTSTPDHSVTDGKCEELHNLRFTGGAWRNVRKLAQTLNATENTEGYSRNIDYKAWCTITGSKFVATGEPTEERLEKCDLYTTTETIKNASAVSNKLKGSDLFLKKSNNSVEYVGKNQYVGSPQVMFDFDYTLGEDFYPSFEDRKRSVKGAIRYAEKDRFNTLYKYNNGAYLCEKKPRELKVGDNIYFSDTASIRIDGVLESISTVYPYGKITNITSPVNNSSVTLTVFSRNNEEEVMDLDTEFDTTSEYLLQAYAVPGTETNIENVFYRKDNLFFIYDTEITAYGDLFKAIAYVTKEAELAAYTIQTPPYMYRNLRRYAEEDFSTITRTTNYTIVYTHPADKEGCIIKGFSKMANSDDPQTSVPSFSRAIIGSDGIREDGYSVISTIKQDHEYTISHLGRVLIISDQTDKINYYYLFNGVEYERFSSNSIGVSAEVAIEKICPVSGTNVSYKAGLGDFYDGKGIIQEYIAKNGELTWANANEKNNAWRGEIGLFCAVRSEDGTILKTTPVQIVSTFEDDYGEFRLNDNKYIKDYLEEPNNDGYSGITVNADGALLSSVVNLYQEDKGSQRWIQDDIFELLGNTAYDWNNPNAPNISSPMRLAVERILPYHIMCRAKCTISFDSIKTHELVDNIAVYCTRIYPPFVKDGIFYTVSGTTLSGQTFVSPTNLFDEPYYLLKAIPVKEFKITDASLSYELTIDYNSLKNIQSQPSYEAVSSSENLFFGKCKEYNNRLHLSDITNNPLPPTSAVFTFAPINSDSSIGDKGVVEYKKNGNTYRSIFSAPDISGQADTGFSSTQKIYMSYLITNATFYLGRTYDSDPSTMYARFKIATNNSYGLGLSYAIGDARANENSSTTRTYNCLKKYAPIQNSIPSNRDTTISYSNLSAYEPNRIQVTEANNPLALPYKLSYYIGSDDNEIMAVNSAAIEMSDSKFGEFPLYIFSADGIYAMQSGQESVYSSVIPINYDVVANPETLSVGNGVLYITGEGLKSLTSEGIHLLSLELNNANGLPKLEYLQGANMYYSPVYNEIIVHNNYYDFAYVYSIPNKMWSTRSFVGEKLNSQSVYVHSQDENIAHHTIYDLSRQELEEYLPITLTTRPIKLGSMELKRAETMIVRFECATEQTLKVKVEGSIDTNTWHTLREITTTTNKDVVIRRTPFSVKYLRFTIEGNVTDDIRILAFELEYYERMRHRMR